MVVAIAGMIFSNQFSDDQLARYDSSWLSNLRICHDEVNMQCVIIPFPKSKLIYHQSKIHSVNKPSIFHISIIAKKSEKVDNTYFKTLTLVRTFVNQQHDLHQVPIDWLWSFSIQ
jgi:hypothetical protein